MKWHAGGSFISGEFRSFDTVVWLPDDFGAPEEQVCDWFDEWLAEGPNRTLIYVGRDFDAAPLYWRKVQPLVAPESQPLYQERALEAEFSRGWQRSQARDRLECPWFEIQLHGRRDVHELAGPWSVGIDAAKADIELRNLMRTPRPRRKTADLGRRHPGGGARASALIRRAVDSGGQRVVFAQPAIGQP